MDGEEKHHQQHGWSAGTASVAGAQAVEHAHRNRWEVTGDLCSFPSSQTRVLNHASLPLLPLMPMAVAQVPGSMCLCLLVLSCLCDLPCLTALTSYW